jgi:hypothetical protein
MAHFSLEAEIQSAMHGLDNSINVRKVRATVKSTGGCGLNTSSKQFNTSGLNRSRSESRLHTALFANSSRIGGGGGGSPKRRSVSRGRTGGSLLDLSSAGMNNKSPGRVAATDRFIPNRSTTDMEYAQHSMSRLDRLKRTNFKGILIAVLNV